MEKVIERIAQYRNKKGYTYENMADELGLTTAAYRKIEMGETKLTVERLFRIANILEAPVSDILEYDSVNQIQNNYHNTNVFQQRIEHFYQENKEITEQLIIAKNQLIEVLQNELQLLKNKQ
ncbi:MAG: helix-turn-helix domain-containing protein [Cruoricaptor ignavus]|nr:helix-turn-helix domain-containing protein [Cruoricaptor ignavus]